MQLLIRPSLTGIITAITSLTLALLYFAFFTTASAYVAYAVSAALSLMAFVIGTLLATKTRGNTWQSSSKQTHASPKTTKHE